jgi:hypothetical protein
MGRIESMVEDWEVDELRERVWGLERAMKDVKVELADIRLYLDELASQALKNEELLQRLTRLLDRLFDFLELFARDFYETYNKAGGKLFNSLSRDHGGQDDG